MRNILISYKSIARRRKNPTRKIVLDRRRKGGDHLGFESDKEVVRFCHLYLFFSNKTDRLL